MAHGRGFRPAGDGAALAGVARTIACAGARAGARAGAILAAPAPASMRDGRAGAWRAKGARSAALTQCRRCDWRDRTGGQRRTRLETAKRGQWMLGLRGCLGNTPGEHRRGATPTRLCAARIGRRRDAGRYLWRPMAKDGLPPAAPAVPRARTQAVLMAVMAGGRSGNLHQGSVRGAVRQCQEGHPDGEQGGLGDSAHLHVEILSSTSRVWPAAKTAPTTFPISLDCTFPSCAALTQINSTRAKPARAVIRQGQRCIAQRVDSRHPPVARGTARMFQHGLHGAAGALCRVRRSLAGCRSYQRP